MKNILFAKSCVTSSNLPRCKGRPRAICTAEVDILRDPHLSKISKSQKRLEIETPLQRTTNRKWHMGYQMVTWPMTSR